LRERERERELNQWSQHSDSLRESQKERKTARQNLAFIIGNEIARSELTLAGPNESSPNSVVADRPRRLGTSTSPPDTGPSMVAARNRGEFRCASGAERESAPPLSRGELEGSVAGDKLILRRMEENVERPFSGAAGRCKGGRPPSKSVCCGVIPLEAGKSCLHCVRWIKFSHPETNCSQ
jgi:hypothetical protein